MAWQAAARRSASSLSLANHELRVAVVGAGPSAFYAASRLLAMQDSARLRVDMYEELPVPFGLVRYGVAPDHPEVKNCIHKVGQQAYGAELTGQFEETATDPRFRFFGNAQVGALSRTTGFVAPDPPDASPEAGSSAVPIPLEWLRTSYHAVLLAYGAARDRALGIPGEDTLANVHSARSFVHVYNGHPYADLVPSLDLSKVRRVTIVGHGNVALDCARMLLAPVDELAKTDVPEPVLAELARSRVEHVDVVGRRGPLQVSFTTKELRELLNLRDVSFGVDGASIAEAQETLDAHPKMEGSRPKRRMLDLMRKARPASGSDKRSWSLGFLRSPVELLPRSDMSGTVGAVRWQRNRLDADGADPSTASAIRTDQFETVPTDLVLKSVGYRSIGLPGLPFDARRGVVRNDGGRVIDDAGAKVRGLYASGWLARGPTGVIATTMGDAYATADIIGRDLLAGADALAPVQAADPTALAGPGKLVSWDDWLTIDNEERRRGQALGKPREKITSIAEMLALL